MKKAKPSKTAVKSIVATSLMLAILAPLISSSISVAGFDEERAQIEALFRPGDYFSFDGGKQGFVDSIDEEGDRLAYIAYPYRHLTDRYALPSLASDSLGISFSYGRAPQDDFEVALPKPMADRIFDKGYYGLGDLPDLGSLIGCKMPLQVPLLEGIDLTISGIFVAPEQPNGDYANGSLDNTLLLGERAYVISKAARNRIHSFYSQYVASIGEGDEGWLYAPYGEGPLIVGARAAERACLSGDYTMVSVEISSASGSKTISCQRDSLISELEDAAIAEALGEGYSPSRREDIEALYGGINVADYYDLADMEVARAAERQFVSFLQQAIGQGALPEGMSYEGVPIGGIAPEYAFGVFEGRIDEVNGLSPSMITPLSLEGFPTQKSAALRMLSISRNNGLYLASPYPSLADKGQSQFMILALAVPLAVAIIALKIFYSRKKAAEGEGMEAKDAALEGVSAAASALPSFLLFFLLARFSPYGVSAAASGLAFPSLPFFGVHLGVFLAGVAICLSADLLFGLLRRRRRKRFSAITCLPTSDH